MSRPVPASVKLLRGNPGCYPIPEEPQPTLGLPACPEHLEPIAKELWAQLAGELTRMGIAECDATALERLCACYARVRLHEDNIARDGLTYRNITRYGGEMVRANPELAMLIEDERELRFKLAELGLSMSSRCRLDIKKLGIKKGGDSVSELSRKRESHVG